MKRLTYTAVAATLLAMSGATVTLAKNDPAKPKNNRVLMCTYLPDGGAYEIYVKDKDVDSHLAMGDTLGYCETLLPQ